MSDLTPKQSRFIDEYMIDLNATQAAIRAGYSKSRSEVTGCELLKKSKVSEEIRLRQDALAETHGVTLKILLDELDEAREAALGADTVQSSAAVAATMAKAKLCGLVIDKQEAKTSGTVKHLVAEAPKLSKEEWLKAHKLGA